MAVACERAVVPPSKQLTWPREYIPIYYISSGFMSRLNETEFIPEIAYALLLGWSLLITETGYVWL